VTERKGQLVLQEPLELAVADHLVQRIDARRADLDEDVVAPEVTTNAFICVPTSLGTCPPGANASGRSGRLRTKSAAPESANGDVPGGRS
jgi:hypothetical protein